MDPQKSPGRENGLIHSKLLKVLINGRNWISAGQGMGKGFKWKSGEVNTDP